MLANLAVLKAWKQSKSHNSSDPWRNLDNFRVNISASRNVVIVDREGKEIAMRVE